MLLALGMLKGMGWPRSKGLLRRQYVLSLLVDTAVEQSMALSVGIGAGRPRFGAAILVQMFGNNPWTEESTAELLQHLKEDAEQAVQDNPTLPPSKALWATKRVAPHGNEIPWSILETEQFDAMVGMTSAKAIYWGLRHSEEMPSVFAAAKENYERDAPDMIRHGLDVSRQYSWESLEALYDTCEEIVRGYEADVQPLPSQLPSALVKTPEIAHRLAP
jgi:hypothetical protein